jgi:hypothetical protein
MVSIFHPSSPFLGEGIFNKPLEDISAGPSQFAISVMVEERVGSNTVCLGAVCDTTSWETGNEECGVVMKPGL